MPHAGATFSTGFVSWLDAPFSILFDRRYDDPATTGHRQSLIAQDGRSGRVPLLRRRALFPARYPIPAPARLRLLLAMLSLLQVGSPVTRAEGAQEYQVKAAMVINMAKYVEWPAESFPRSGAPLQLCRMGRGPFTQALEQYQGKTVLGHPISLRGVAPGDDLSECHVLVLSGIDKRRLAGVLEQARRRGVLTVSDIQDFAHFGGVIGMVESEGRVLFEINLKAARQSRVRINSQLLKLARLIREGDQ